MRQSTQTSRRRFLKGTAATTGLAVGAGAFTGFPFIRAADPVTLRIAGTGVNQFKELADKCKLISASLFNTLRWSRMTSSNGRSPNPARSIFSIRNIGC